jgi:hypothetical protein
LCDISHESFKFWFWKLVQHHLIKFFPHDLLSFSVLKLHVTNRNGHHFTIRKIVHMKSHSCSTINTLHMIKHDPSVLQIPYRLHLRDKASSITHIVYQHLENENLMYYNLFSKTTFLNVVIMTLGLQFKDVINIATP